MKKIKKALLLTATCGLLSISSCKEETVTPVTTTTNFSSCTIASISETNGDALTFTFDGTMLTTLAEKYQSGTDTYTFTYTGGKVTEIKESTYTYKLIYTGNNATRIDLYEDGENIAYTALTYGATGKVKTAEIYYIDGTDNIISETFTYTFTGDNCTKMVNSADTDEDGVLDTEYDITYTMSGFDDKINPYYGLPLFLIELDNMAYLNKNNATAGAISVLSESTPLSSTYEYNSAGYPTKMSAKTGNAGAVITSFTYNCK